MIISHKYAFVFLSVPRTASTTVQNHLSKYGEAYMGIENHLTRERVIDVIGDDMWRAYKTGCFIRNPWARMVSLYLWVRRLRSHWRHPPKTYGFENFTDFVFRQIYNPQSKFVLHPDTDEVDINFVGRYENLSHDIRALFNYLGLEPFNEVLRRDNQMNGDVTVVRENGKQIEYQEGRKLYTDYYTDELINFVAEKERKIIDLMGYHYGEDVHFVLHE